MTRKFAPRPSKPPDRKGIRPLDILMVGVTAVAAVAAVASAVFFWMQLTAMQAQLDVMQSENRPWLKAELFPSTNIMDLPDGPWGFLQVKLTNVGNAPAGDVWVDFRLTAEPYDPMIMVNKSQEVKEFCENNSAVSWRSLHSSSVTVFPNETYEHPVSLSLRKSDVKGKLNKYERYMVLLVGCAIYSSADATEWHRTGFSFVVGDSVKTNLISLTLPNLRWASGVAKKDIRVSKIDSGGFAD